MSVHPRSRIRSLSVAVVLLLTAIGIGCSGDEDRSRLLGPAGGLGVVNPHDLYVPVPPNPGDFPDEWCFFLADGADPHAIADELGMVVRRHLPQSRLALLVGDLDAQALDDVDGVRAAEPNDAAIWAYPVELTLGFSQGEWDEEAVSGQDLVASLELAKVHEKTKGEAVRVAVLDTGVEPGHPHLAGRVDLLPGWAPLGSVETPDGIDDDQNGVVDDGYGHGTHVAGLVLTVAPAARVLSIRVLNEEGWGSLFDVAVGLSLARQHQVDVVNLSLILSDPSPIIDDLLADLSLDGITVSAASGNTYEGVAYPASNPLALSVAATDTLGLLAPFSGAFTALVAAPGVQVASSFQADLLAYGTGTSMSAGVASGCLALVIAYFNGPSGVGSGTLCESAVPLEPPGALAHGRVRPWKAIQSYPVLSGEESR
jgi:hypothetical protein